MGFEALPSALDEGRALTPITKEQVAFPDETLSDDSALALVIQDVTVAEQFLQSKTLPAEWNTASELYRARSTPQTWAGTNKPRANMPMPVVMEAVESLLPQAHMAFFSDPQPFLLDPKGKTTPACARAMSHVVCWGVAESEFEEEIRKIIKSALQYGTGVAKWGWEIASHNEKTYSRNDTGVESESEEHEVSRPTFEYVDLRNLLVDPSANCHDIRRARYIISQTFLNATELDALRDMGYKNVPSRGELANILAERAEQTKNSLQAQQNYTFRENQAQIPTQASSADPLKQPLELLEYWTDDRVITVLQRCIILRNEENEFGSKPFLSCAFIDVLNSFYGFGVAKLLEGEQRFQTGVVNAWIDSLSLRLNPVWQRKKGIGSKSQSMQISPGFVANDDGELTPLQIPDVTQEALEAINSSEMRASRRVGSNYGPEMPTQAMRTAEGVQAFTSGVQVRLQYFVESFANLVFIPAIEKFIELAKDKLQPEQINAILSDRDGKAFEGDVLDVYNGKYTVDVLTSTKLAGRRAMAQMIPLLLQMTGAQPVQEALQIQNKKFDFVELLQQVLDVTGWQSDNLVVDMTPEDQQRAQMMNQAVVKAQATAMQTQQQHQNDMALEDNKAMGRAGVAVIKHTLDASAEPPAEPLATGPKA